MRVCDISHYKFISNNVAYYQLGYIDGYADNQTDGHIEYIYHHHDSDLCGEATCRIKFYSQIYEYHPDHDPPVWTFWCTYEHLDCGSGSNTHLWSSEDRNAYQPCIYTHTYYTCGYSEGQLIGAIISFD